MRNKESIKKGLDELRHEFGDWTYDIPLPFGIWTRGDIQMPHTRLKRIVQNAVDLLDQPLSRCRILDLACLDGIFSIEFAQHGADVIGVEIREANIRKAIFCRDVLELDNLEFRQDDVRNISVQSYGNFDAIICSGILYHLPAADAINLVNTMFEMTSRLVVIDTHIALELGATESVEHDQSVYWGKFYREHSDDDSPEVKAKKLWSSADNPTSFWFSRPSLINILSKAGFSSVYECFVPAHLNCGQPGLEDRCTFVAIKNEMSDLTTAKLYTL